MNVAAKWVMAVAVCALLVPAASLASDDPGSQELDVILLLDTSESMSGMSTGSILDFADRFRPSQRLGVITFGEKPQIVHPLGSAVADEDRAELKKAVGKLQFQQSFKDVPGGLELALTHLTTQGRKDARKVVILLSSGLLTPAHDYSTHDEVLQYLREHSLYDYYLEEIPIYAVAFGDQADIPMMREMGSSTRGKYLVAPDAEALDDVLSVLLEGIQPPRTSRDEELDGPTTGRTAAPAGRADRSAADDSPPSELTWILAVLVGLLVIFNLTALVLLAFNTIRMRSMLERQAEPQEAESQDEAPEFTSLRKKASTIASLLEEARGGLDGFNVDLEDFGAESWEREKSLRRKYGSIVDSLFLLMDHIQVEEDAGRTSVDLDWVRERMGKLMEQEGIREIPVREGDEFDGMYHKHAGDRPHKTPPQTILEVSRRGYYVPQGPDDEDDVILRHAEVVVSRGPGRG